MKQIEFDENKARYDEFNRPFICDDVWLKFNTGEVCFMTSGPDPADRRIFHEYGVNIFMAGDRHAPQLYMKDGTKVPTSWLTQGNISPYMVADYATGHVVKLERQRDNRQLPYQLRHFAAYWAGEDAIPIGGKIVLHPVNTFTQEERAFVTECGAAAEFELKITRQGTDETLVLKNTPFGKASIVEYMAAGLTPMDLVKMCSDRLLKQIIAGPIAAVGRVSEVHDYLYIKE